MSKHHAVEDEPQSSDMSWILGLARPAETSTAARSDAPAPYYGSLVARAPRHAAPADDLDEVRPEVGNTTTEPAAAQTGPLGRISAEQIDTLIGRLDGVDATPEAPEASAEPDARQAPTAQPEDPTRPEEPIDVGFSLLHTAGDEHDTAPDERSAPVGDDHDDHENLDDPDGSDGHDDHDGHDGHQGRNRPGGAAAQEDAPGEQTGPPREVVPPTNTSSARLVTPRRGYLRKPVLLGAAAALCLLTVGGGTMAGGTLGATATGGQPATGKTVSIVVDGRTERVSTASDSVAGALATAGITLDSHDFLTPGAATPISDGATIVLDRGRLLTLTIDGRQRQIWTTARTVDEALAQLGTRTSDWSLSANRSRAIPLAGLAVSGATLHTVAVAVGGNAAQSSTTTAATVGDLLAQQKVTLGPHDTVSPAPGTTLSDGLVVTVDRVVVSSASSRIALPQPASRTVDDATIVKGTTKLTQAGRPGSELITYTVTSVNGRQTARTEKSRRTVVAPVGAVTHVGTRSSFTYVGSEVFTNDTSFGVNWDGLAMCESTHNPTAVNANPVAGLPTYGMFQFDLPTWASVGGSGNPIDASPEEQLMRAKILFQQRGLEPWACRDSAH